ncbi:ABC transporter permease [Candidatus Marsarchaeota archaeon]|nr:ABC transporter permease [Candidatus Marsarchaeota archaeon]
MTGTLDAAYTIWLREMKRFLKSKFRMIGSGGQPLIWLAIVGVGLGSAFALHVGSSGIPYLTFVSPGLIGMVILFSSIFAGVSVIWDKQFGFLKEILVAPISRFSIVLGKIAGSSTIAVFTALIILVIVVVFGIIPIGSLSAVGVIEAILFMLMAAATFVAMGLIIAALINNIESFQVLINFLVMPLFFLSSALFPVSSSLPIWLNGLAHIDPLFYSIDGMRGALVHFSTYPMWIDAIATIIGMVIFVGAATLLFKRIEGK